MKILICGDVHGRLHCLQWLQSQVKKQIPECETCIQVGDFGFYPRIMDSFTAKLPMKTYAIDGNHEDHIWLRKVENKGHWDKWKERNDIWFVDRGEVLEIDGATIGFIGGAMNVDRPNSGSTRLKYNNYVSKGDVKHALSNFNKYMLDLIIAHSCPTGVGVNIPGEPIFVPGVKQFICDPFQLPMPPLEDSGEHALADLWNGLTHKPSVWMFGHFHKYHQKQVEGTEFVCVGSTDPTTDGYTVMPFIYDTVDKTITVGDKVPHFHLRGKDGRV